MDDTRVSENFKAELEPTRRKGELDPAGLNFIPLPCHQTKLTPEQLADAERAVAKLKAGSRTTQYRISAHLRGSKHQNESPRPDSLPTGFSQSQVTTSHMQSVA